MTLKVKDKEYKVRFTYNSFADSDLLDRTFETLTLVQEMINANEETNSIETLKKLFVLTRELLFVGFKKENPVESVEAVGDILDDYLEEDSENHGLINTFNLIAGELLASGFFGEVLRKSTEAMKNQTTSKMKSAAKKK